MLQNPSRLKKIHVEKFRGLKNIDIPFGDRITVICGKNGTSKSTILGIVAQIFSFRTDYSEDEPKKNELLKYRTLGNDRFESTFGNHFRFSKYDKSGDMSALIKFFDAYEQKTFDNLELRIYDYKDRQMPRPVLRGIGDHNLTLPVIYISLKRLIPIATRKKYEPKEDQYISDHKNEIISLNNKILTNNLSKITATTGDIDSLVVHGDNYDQNSVSVGEDNTGQIIEALLSFKRLKEEYSNYPGGILLIDEADAGLFPAAQIGLIKSLTKITKDLNLQVIMTSHSPTLIQEVYELNQNDSKKYQTVYLTDSFGEIEVMENFGWAQIESDLRIETIPINENKFPKIRVYCEDKEAYDLFNNIVIKRSIKKIIQPMKALSLGCDQLKALHDSKIPEFYDKSIIVLDGDHPIDKGNMLSLPGELSPDQLLFEFLYNLDSNDTFWRDNELGFTKKVFQRAGQSIINTLELTGKPSPINLNDEIKAYRQNDEIKAYHQTEKNNHGKLREIFKTFYKNQDIQNILKSNVKTHPFRKWMISNKKICDKFVISFSKKLRSALIKNHVPTYKVDGYFKQKKLF